MCMQERLELYRRSQDDRAKAVAQEEAERRQRQADARHAQQAGKERRRIEVYALNVVMRM